MKIPKLKLNKIKIFFKKLPRILGEHAFLTLVALLFGGLVFGGLIFYNYSILIQKAEPEVFEKPIRFKEKIYQKILEEWQAREKRFKEAELKEDSNLFEAPIEVPTPAEELTE